MKKTKTGLLLAVLFCVIGATAVFAEVQVTVAVYPFHVQAEKANEKIRTAVPGMLAERLEKDGAKIVLVEQETDTSGWDFEQFRKEGIRLGADWILTGDIFMAGQGISIDTRMVNVYEERLPLTFFAQAPSMGELFSAVSGLAKSVAGELFEKRIVSAIKVTGNNRVESDAVLRVITLKTGDLINPDSLNKNLRLVYEMGYFDNVIIEKTPLDRGVELVFKVKEKPSVRKISFKKNVVFEEKELFEAISTSTGSILNQYKINSDVEKLQQLYFEKNYHNCKISYQILPLEKGQADISFTIDEGDKIRVESITFDGNKYFKADDLKDVMETKEKGFWSFITSSGDLDETELDNDVIRIESLYKNNGFINVKVSDPNIDLGKKSISVSFKIEEGDQYRNGDITIQGDILTSKQELMDMLTSRPQDLYNREMVRKDMIALNNLYADNGYANAQVAPLISKDVKTKTVKITYDIKQGDLVHFNRIIISGNTSTRDKVIRRELAIKEQGLYSMKDIQRSHRNLNVKDFFSKVEITPVKTDVPNERDVEVKVEEKSTGNFSFGGGFSSDDGAFGQFAVQERNLFGRGQTAKFTIRMSGENALFNIGFTEPWLFDKPISAGFDLYKYENEYDNYEKDAIGLTLRFGSRQIWDYTSVGVIYNIEKFDISDVDEDETNVRDGSFLSSSIQPYISYDSRNHRFLPTEGMYHRASVEYAGEFLGGEIDFTKYLVESAFFYPIFKKLSAGFYAKAGYLDDRTNGDPDIDWERFYLGGINSIRGFGDTDINATPDGETIDVGGVKFVQFNLEFMVPIAEDMGVYGVMFYDRGDVYANDEDIDLAEQFSSAGLEFRWNSPMGPIRLAYGWVVEGKDVKSTGEGQFDFSVGAFF